MTLAPTPALERDQQPQHQQQEGNKHDELQAKGSQQNKPRVPGLKNLWESKRQSQTAFQHTSATSSPTTPSVGEWNPPYIEDNRTRTHEFPHSLPGRTTKLEAKSLLGNSANSKGSSQAKVDQSEQSLEADSSRFYGRSRSSIRPTKSIAIPIMNIRSLSTRNLPSGSSYGTDRSSERISETQDEWINPRTLSTNACHSSTRSTSSAHSNPLSPTPRRGWFMESRIPPASDHQEQQYGSRDPSLDETSTAGSEYHSMDLAEPPNSAQTLNDPRRDDTLSLAETTRIPQHKDNHNPAAPRLSGTRDAGTQTDSLYVPDLEDPTSLWSESESIAERRGHHLSHHRSSKPVRLERRLGRRPGIRKVQVIVSLDGATDVVIDAGLKRKRRRGGSRS
ncbi:MAG: hypothetical protein Q9221_002937 [Calogaya cf. arnoldii]